MCNDNEFPKMKVTDFSELEKSRPGPDQCCPLIKVEGGIWFFTFINIEDD